MAQGQKRNRALVPQSAQALERLKQEVATELGIQNYQGYLGDIPARLNGAVGGNMVRRMIAAAEQALIQQTAAQVQAGFRQGLLQQATPTTPAAQTPNPFQVQVPPAQ
ncbi:MAG TPA: alpha/beta-type small acid-soluble spore protein [Limnochordales bacterium]